MPFMQVGNYPTRNFATLGPSRITAAVYKSFHFELAPILLTYLHRAGVSLYTSFYNFAETCVFNKQSLPPILCHFNKNQSTPYSEVTESICRVPLIQLIQAPQCIYTYPPVSVLVRFLFYCNYFLKQLFRFLKKLLYKIAKLILFVIYKKIINQKKISIKYSLSFFFRNRLTVAQFNLKQKTLDFRR